MTFFFSANQISGFTSGTSKFTLNNPLSFVASRIDNNNDATFDVLLYGLDDSTETSSQLLLSDSKAADGQSINYSDITAEGDWVNTESRTIPTSDFTKAGDLGKVNTENFSSIFNTGDFKLKIQENGKTDEQEAIRYDASANGLVATFANGVKIQLSSPNTVIQIPLHDLENNWAKVNLDNSRNNGEWAQDLKYSQTNYQRSIETIATVDPNSFPTGDSVTLSAPIEDGDRIMVAFQFPVSSATFGKDSANPLIKLDQATNSWIPKTESEWKNSYFPSFKELKENGKVFTGDYPWYGAVINDPSDPASTSSQNSQPYFYLNGALGVNRTDQFDANLINGTYNNLDPYDRFPDVVGVTGDNFGNFQFVVTMLVPKDTVFRPKGGGFNPNNLSDTGYQEWNDTTAGALNYFSIGENGKYDFNFPEGEEIPFHNPEIGKGLLETVPDAGDSLSFSEWYENWWNTQTKGGGFPWTGRGYTYDPYYPTNEGWEKSPALGPGVGELVQAWRPEDANKDDWRYEIKAVKTIPEALGAAATASGSSWQLNIKRLGQDDANVYIYKADSVTGLLVKDETTQTIDGNDITIPYDFYYPNDDGYLEAAIERAKKDGVSIDSSDLPDWGEEKNYNFNNLNTGNNYGFVIEVNGNLFGTYGATSENFMALSNPQSTASLSLGFEDTKMMEGGDNDFNDLIFTVTTQD